MSSTEQKGKKELETQTSYLLSLLFLGRLHMQHGTPGIYDPQIKSQTPNHRVTQAPLLHTYYQRKRCLIHFMGQLGSSVG